MKVDCALSQRQIISEYIPREQGPRGPHGTHLSPVGLFQSWENVRIDFLFDDILP